MTLHTLRHTHATRLVQNGLSVYEIKDVLGHADVKTTMRYAHLEQQVVLARARDVIDRVAASWLCCSDGRAAPTIGQLQP